MSAIQLFPRSPILPLSLSDFAPHGYFMDEMQPKSDAQLLREYAQHGAEPAFTELVHRYTNLVYSSALRQVDSPDLAADVAQRVFIGLAHGAQKLSPRLSDNASLAGWLCRSARNLSLNLRRNAFRQQSRERQAMEQLAPLSEPPPDWENLRPVLDDAMSQLSEPDYDALVLRFFNHQDLRSVGRALGVSDDTAQKRVSRALDKLREHLSRRGISSSAGALSLALSAHAVQAAPAGLAATISSALTGTAIAATTSSAALQTIAMTTLQKTVLTTTLALAVAAPLVLNHQAQKQLREQNAAWQQQLQQEQDTNAQLRAENDRLAKQLATNNSGSDDPSRELLRLRGEVAALRNQGGDLDKLRAENRQLRSAQNARAAAPNDTQADYFPRESWAFAGYADPASALQSAIWAMSKGDLKTLFASLHPAEAARLQKQFEGKTPDQIAAAFNSDIGNMAGFRILEEKVISDDETILTVYNQGKGKDETAMLKFIRVGNDWKMAGPVKDTRAGK